MLGLILFLGLCPTIFSGYLSTLDHLNSEAVPKIYAAFADGIQKRDFSLLLGKMPSSATMRLARRGRIFGGTGPDLNDRFLPGWDRQLLLGIFSGGSVFEGKSAWFFSRYVAPDRIEELQGRFFPVNTRNNLYLFFYLQKQDYTLLILLPSDFSETFQFIDGEKVHSESDTEEIWPDYVFIGILVLCLLAMLSVRVRGRFEWRMAVAGCAFCTCICLLVLKLRRDFQPVILQREINNFHDSSIAEMKRREAFYTQRMAQFARAIFADIEAGRDPNFQGFGGTLAWGNLNAEVAFTPKNAPPVVQSLFCKFYPILLERTGQVFSPEKLARLQSCEKQEEIVHLIPREQLSEEVSDAEAGQPLRLDDLGFGDNGFSWFWFLMGEGPSLRLYSYMHKTADILERYWKEQLQESKTLVAVLGQDNLYIGSTGYPEVQVNRFKISDQRAWGFQLEGRYYYLLRGQRFSNLSYVFSVSESKVSQAARQFDKLCLLAVLICPALYLLGCLRFLGRLRFRLDTLLTQLQSAGKGQYVRQEAIWAEATDEVQQLRNDLDSMVTELAAAQEAWPFVASEILTLFSDSSGHLKSEVSGEAAVVFSDIRGFTTLTQSHDPQMVVSLLNEYFAIWQSESQKRGGIIEKFIGDAVVVMFLKNKSSSYIQDALETCLAVRSSLSELNSRRRQESLFEVQNGYGVSAGFIRLRVIGDEHRRYLYMNSDVSSRAETLEAISKSGKSTALFVDQAIYSSLRQSYDWIFHDTHQAWELEQ